VYWGMVALAITVTEILGALSKAFRDWIPWPTISGTVGHLEDIDGRWGLAVIALIAITAFYAVAYSKGEAQGTGTKAVVKVRSIQFRYGWPLVLAAVAVIATIVWFSIEHEGSDVRKWHLAYAIYGSFAVIGVAIPSILIWRKSEHVVFPGLFYTFRKLRGRLPVVATAVVAALALLVLHLGLYPWPNLAREPAKFAGLNAFHAKATAIRALEGRTDTVPGLVYSTQGRGVSKGQNVWFVYFNEALGKDATFNGCVVETTDERAVPTKECLQG